ncbi:helix-turn-helix domain-containing protein [Oscillatoria sp. FACHB-1407]|uniref:helix-turn-helix domain-containing protein n=1 Tax=Oscillatoria sp. FACHB-1407 TaxID=2692847 RepID=UPI0016820655|nr:helix-turn-helix transcriptional regulator [Oscillatoria sp. FACHB-1407]MBD2459437.1 helix-turn-helix domain-containing protein [Oscillatoria sp. FACHB-1407]
MKGGNKYEPLLNYLRRSDRPEITLTFTEIETIIGDELPTSARRQKAWWSNRTKGALQASAWMMAGYLVEAIDVAHESVTFRKPSTEYAIQRVGDTVLWNAELIKALRRHMGLSQVEFAQKLGVRQQTVSDWETSVYDPRLSTSKYLTMVAEQAGFKYGQTDIPPKT